MYKGCLRMGMALMVSVALFAMGCGGDSDAGPETSTGRTRIVPGDLGRPAPDGGRRAVDTPPKPTTIPEVRLTEQDMMECFVKVGDPMPAIELSDTSGQTLTLAGLLGTKGTIVFFFKPGEPYSMSELSDMGPDFAAPREIQGVKVVGIAVDEAAGASSAVAEATPPFPVLVDTMGEALAKVGTEKLMPRTFLLDADGKILWFDVEYSQSTTRELTTALDVAIGPLPSQE